PVSCRPSTPSIRAARKSWMAGSALAALGGSPGHGASSFSLADSLQFVGHLVEARLYAGFVLVAAGCTRHAGRADHLFADHDGQRALGGDHVGQIDLAVLRVILEPLHHLAGRDAER